MTITIKENDVNFLTDITHRDGKGSSKKLWYNLACVAATVCLLWITYKDTFEDWAYICLYLIYLACIGGFEVVPKMMAMIIEYKNGKPLTTTTTIQEVKTG
jgi:hypothetical protein